MWWKKKPPKPSHNQIIDAILGTVLGTAAGLRSGQRFHIRVTDLPEDARGFVQYDLERVSDMLSRRGIIPENLSGSIFDFRVR